MRWLKNEALVSAVALSQPRKPRKTIGEKEGRIDGALDAVSNIRGWKLLD